MPDGYLYIVPAAGYYYDYLNTEMLYKKWTPAHIGKEVFPEKHKQIKGGMFAVWNDHAGNGISTKAVSYTHLQYLLLYLYELVLQLTGIAYLEEVYADVSVGYELELVLG